MKAKKIIVVGLSSVLLGGFVAPTISNINVHASEYATVYKDRQLTLTEVKKIEKYITIQNKRYVLSTRNNLSGELKYLAEKHIEKANSLLNQYHGFLFEDKESKTLLGSTLLDRAPGKNDIEFHWNYARVYIDAPNIRLLGAGLVGGAAGGLGFAVQTFGLSVLVGIVSGIVGHKLSEIQDGIWFDYNYVLGITQKGWQ